VTLSSGVRPTHVQAILDTEVDTPTRTPPSVLLEEIDGEEVVVPIQATPERSEEGAKLADEIIAALASVTGEHELQSDGPAQNDGPHRREAPTQAVNHPEPRLDGAPRGEVRREEDTQAHR